jgi:hypothetical protein
MAKKICKNSKGQISGNQKNDMINNKQTNIREADKMLMIEKEEGMKSFWQESTTIGRCPMNTVFLEE